MTFHELEPADDENMSMKPRVARNIFRVHGEDSVKFYVNEEAWPTAELAIHSSNEGTLIDGFPADKVFSGVSFPRPLLDTMAKYSVSWWITPSVACAATSL